MVHQAPFVEIVYPLRDRLVFRRPQDLRVLLDRGERVNDGPVSLPAPLDVRGGDNVHRRPAERPFRHPRQRR